MQLQPTHKMIFNMTRYGVVLGGLAGSLAAITLILTSQSFSFLSNIPVVMVLEAVLIAVFGLIFGGFFGLMSGLYSGISMAVIAASMFKDIRSRQMFKGVMGLIAGLVSAHFFYSGLWNLRIDGIEVTSWNATMVMGVVLAIYASQRVASLYLFEWSIRKQKSYA